jgi:ubiquinone/menaquinone biosynthesis C-methylase UbiE
MNVMRKLRQYRLTNARQPAGRFGRFLINLMNLSHSQMTDWGVGHLSIGANDTILDVGCGGGGAIHRLARKTVQGKVCGVDFSPESVKVSLNTNRQAVQQGRVEIQQGSVSSLPYPDCTFDLVTAVNTHNYWPDFPHDLRETLRVIKPGGRLMIIGSVYSGGKKDPRNQKYAELIKISFPSIDELRNQFSIAGYVDVQAFEDDRRGWMCVLGRKSS